MKIKNCDSLGQVRDEIDKIDEQILELIADRKNYVRQAAKFKHSIEEIKADERVSAVINNMRHRALSLGVSPNLVTEIYTKMIDDMVETEIAQFQNTKSL